MLRKQANSLYHIQTPDWALQKWPKRQVVNKTMSCSNSSGSTRMHTGGASSTWFGLQPCLKAWPTCSHSIPTQWGQPQKPIWSYVMPCVEARFQTCQSALDGMPSGFLNSFDAWKGIWCISTCFLQVLRGSNIQNQGINCCCYMASHTLLTFLGRV